MIYDAGSLTKDFHIKDKRQDVLISIIIPVYQEEKLLPHTLAVFTHTLKKKYKLEIIVSDGGSTDSTLAIAKESADIIVCHTESRRQTIAEGRNMGALVANGDIMVFLNADTIPAYPTEFLETLKEWKDKVYKPCAIACPVQINPDERKFPDTIFASILNFYVGCMVNVFGFGMGRGECQVFEKKAFLDIGGYNGSIPAGEDFEILRRACKTGGLVFEKKLLVYESPRRFRRYGYIRILMEWAVNWFWVIVFGKARSKDWEAIR